MNKQFRMTLLLLVGLIALVLTGCTAKSDSQNSYKLPLGDSGLISEMDFDLYKNTETSETVTNDDGTTTEKKSGFNYDYIGTTTGCTITYNARVMSTSQSGKAIRLSIGYYNGTTYVPVTEKVFETLSGDGFNEETVTFTYTESFTEETIKTAVLKLEFGTQIDKDYYKSQNPGAKTTAVNKYAKTYRSTQIKFNQLNIDGKDILVETDVNGNKTYKVNTDLYYYNTATVSHTSESGTLTLTLNYKGGPWQWIIYVLAEFLYWLTMLVGGQYWLGMLIFTLLLRTLAWPIYAKSNSYTSGMQKVQPEIEKLNKKYEGKTDQNSKMKQQMEMREIMKKNHVSMWGCLLPFLQMPIFLAVYQVVQRFPLTPAYDAVNYKFLFTTFAMNYGTASGHWLLAVLVGVTMIGTQLLSTYFTKRVQKRHTNFYTARNQNKSQNSTMIIMMVVMTGMMVMFAWNSSGIAFYWIIGNLYQILQTLVSKLQEEKRDEKEREKTGKVLGR